MSEAIAGEILELLAKGDIGSVEYLLAGEPNHKINSICEYLPTKTAEQLRAIASKITSEEESVNK